jgi:alpha-glucosidase (family GH31 glycosyl hydrolase)
MLLKGLVLLLAIVPFTLGAYQVVSVANLPSGGQKYVAQLMPNSGGPYGDDISFLSIEVVPYTPSIVRVTMRDANVTRWEVPNVVLLKPQPQAHVMPQYNVAIGTRGSTFSLVVTRLSDGVVVFDTRQTEDMVYENQYLSLSTNLPKQPNVYGLGERAAPLRLPTNETYTIFARDNATPYLQNVYGSHAFYMELRNGSAHGVYLLNSNAMDVILSEGKLQYKVIGGIFDFFFMMGATPKEVVRQYLSIIGKAEMIPYWGLGWQQCRWGYNTLEETKAVVDAYAAHKIPLEVMWNDIDYMDAYKDFTTDPNRFPQSAMKNWIDSLHANQQKYIMIIDPGIKIEAGYPAYEIGLQKDLYIKDKSGKPLVGMVWPGFTFFPDFTHPITPDYWYDQLSQFHQKIPFDGIWIDMNEVANFCDGNCPVQPPIPSLALDSSNLLDQAQTSLSDSTLKRPLSASETEIWKQTQLPGSQTFQSGHKDGKKSSLDFNPNDPPYKPLNGGNPMYSHTIDLSARQHLDIQYNIHTLYGHYEGMATRRAADKIFAGKRSLIVSRSTFAGSGRYMSHWLGDNHSTWDDMHWSIAGVITMGMFGLPHVGADICGFAGNTTKELCTRWIQLGAFYPFSRNHNAIGMISQEPYVFGDDVAKIAATTILLKYSFLPYYYTLHYHAHVHGDPVARGLFYEFPEDPMTAENDVQMLIGPGLLVSPVLAEHSTIVNAYFPAGLWYDFYNGMAINSKGEFSQLDAPIDKINLHVRGGIIIPRQKPEMTTMQSLRNNKYSLLVALDQNGNAAGDLFVDNGESTYTVANSHYIYTTFSHTGNTLTIRQPGVKSYTALQNLGDITFFGVPHTVSQVQVNGTPIAKTLWTYSKSSQRLVIQGLSLALFSPQTISYTFVST